MKKQLSNRIEELKKEIEFFGGKGFDKKDYTLGEIIEDEAFTIAWMKSIKLQAFQEAQEIYDKKVEELKKEFCKKGMCPNNKKCKFCEKFDKIFGTFHSPVTSKSKERVTDNLGKDTPEEKCSSKVVSPPSGTSNSKAMVKSNHIKEEVCAECGKEHGEVLGVKLPRLFCEGKFKKEMKK